MVYIYTLTDPITNELKYCGKTNNIKIRLIGHLKEKKSNKEKIDWIQNIKNKGLKPILEVIDEVSDDDWSFWEKYWISQLKSWNFILLNKNDGGCGGVTGFKHSDEVKRMISEYQLGRKLTNEWKNNISKGRMGMKFTSKHILNLSLSHTGKTYSNMSVYQIDINNGEIINEFFSLLDAYKFLKLPENSSLISTACKGKIKSAYGYYWCYCKDYDKFNFKKYIRVYNPILQYDKYGKFIKEYDNISIAAKKNSLNPSSISHALKDSPSCGGYLWFYKNDFDEKKIIKKLNKIKLPYILYQIDINTNDIIREYSSIKEAQQYTKINHISCVLSGNRKMAGGYLWKKVIL